ncbi:efflux RND transporter periplasmic adaptor subunit [Pleomorphomonas sp. NRK KF1]|uniref:efflux RND transporter periplasmic adaptor subunit n=1 Tax=Pleomorphomonas sp. NRK KF1 TaxID=2943000 RepID=UPI0020434530|nr:efflux RND transporter periplasmic adaptor subunit [Pleomorphomonas sp. NRK KF1]MCM5553910.1 efflux RND transporter periplasmic adaptor subunit [Pleomorphomonas sp. NRK KF1]
MKFWVMPLAGALLAGTIVTLPALAQDEAAAPAATQEVVPTVSVIEASRQTLSQKVIVTGTLVAREQVLVTPGVEGLKIESIHFDAGDRVEEGAVLARLAVDTIDVLLAQNTSQLASTDAQIAQARAQVSSAEALVTQTSQAFQRAQALVGTNAMAKDAFDQRQLAAEQAKAQLQVAKEALSAAEAQRKLVEAQRAETELRRSKTEIKAPRAGLILSRNAVVGQVASASGDPLFVIAEDGDIELDADVTETLLPELAVGQKVTVQPAGSNSTVAGEVRLVLPKIDAATRLGKARIALPDGKDLRVGAFARGTIEVARSEGLVLPVTAVSDENGTPTVQVVKDGVVDTREVKTGLTDAGLVEVTDGLAEGELVVSKAGTFLRGGDKVKPQVTDSAGVKG